MSETDKPAEQPNEKPDAPAETPAPPSLDLSQLEKMLDKRFSGFQSLMDQKLGTFSAELEELKTANLTPEEQEQLDTRKRLEETERLRRENALLKLRKQYPDEVDFLEQFFGAQSLEEQVLATASFRNPKAAAAESDEDEEPEPTPVEANNPRRKTKASPADTGQAMSNEIADQILSAANEPGMLVKIRERLAG